MDIRQDLRHFQSGKLRLLAGLQTAGLQLSPHAAVKQDIVLPIKYFLNLHEQIPLFIILV